LAARRLLAQADANRDGVLDAAESATRLAPEPFAAIDADGDRRLTERELTASLDRAADRLPNLAIPEMNGVGAMEICVSTAEGVCDFISAMDTRRIQEWNTWYHILNCGFPLKVSGETDFPCMSSRRVGQGRVYVRLDPPHPGTRENSAAAEALAARGRSSAAPLREVDFTAWCEGLRAGRSYVSDGYAHAVEFAVDGVRPGTGDVSLAAPGRVRVRAQVAFAAELPVGVAYGNVVPPGGRRLVGDTVELHGPRRDQTQRGGRRLVELVVNGQAAASREVPADGQLHELSFDVPIDRSSWVALRHFPQLHTNPVNVLVAGRPIRASRASARWCIEMTELLWQNRQQRIAPVQREEARQTYDRALDVFRSIAAEAPEAS
jgi:hypothetical protein